MKDKDGVLWAVDAQSSKREAMRLLNEERIRDTAKYAMMGIASRHGGSDENIAERAYDLAIAMDLEYAKAARKLVKMLEEER